MCRDISKVVLTIVNAVLAAFSLVCLCIGIWVAASSGLHQAASAGGQGHLTNSAIAFIVVSVICFLLSICGCVGALKENNAMLIVYSVGLGILVFAQLAIIGIIAAYSSFVNQQFEFGLKLIDEKYFLPFNQINKGGHMTDNDTISLAFYKIHLSLKCCGVNSHKDITNSNTTWSKARPRFNNTAMLVPASCCKFTDEGIGELMKATNWSDFSRYRVSGSQCPMKLQDFNDRGCYPIMKEVIKASILTIILVSSLFTLCCIICIVMACCLMKRYRENQY